MAILKIISHGKRREAKRQILRYVLDPGKTSENLCHVTGDYREEQITSNQVFQEFSRVRALFNKERPGAREYTHGTVSFAPGEIAPEKAKDFAAELAERIFPGHQVLCATHTDTDHCHVHFVVEPVSYVNGAMLHTSKHDLERAKEICNEMCRERGLSVAQKGRHADGIAFADGEVTAWRKNKYHQMVSNPKNSYLIALAQAVEDCADAADSREAFCALMEVEYGWIVTWKDSKKNITFTDSEGHRVRDSNLSKTFHINVSKEALEHEFARHTTAAAAHSGPAKRGGAVATPDLPAGSGEHMAEAAGGKRSGAKR